MKSNLKQDNKINDKILDVDKIYEVQKWNIHALSKNKSTMKHEQ